MICPDCAGDLRPVSGPRCYKCGKPVNGDEEYCRDCSRRQHAFVRGRALLSYRGPVKLSLYRMKYGNRREYARVYGQTMAHRLGPWICQCGIGLIIPVPLHPSRKRKRGYNQAELIARELSKNLNLICASEILVRTRKTTPMKELNDEERRKNVERAFLVKENVVKYKKILLVDDIYTTGSTMESCAKALLAAGVQQVYGFALSSGRDEA